VQCFGDTAIGGHVPGGDLAAETVYRGLEGGHFCGSGGADALFHGGAWGR
jgi:hypothetical protein